MRTIQLSIVSWAVLICLAAGCRSVSDTRRVGVLLPLSGEEAVDFKETLDWAVEMVNQSGGLDGKPVSLVYHDTHRESLPAAAQSLVDDEDVKVVIGPNSSSDVFQIAPLFLQARKLLISPTATSADIFRAFAGQRYFWRTCQGDVGQLKVMLHVLREQGVNDVALLCEMSPYGDTFRDWAAFFATEMGMNLTSVVRFPPGTDHLERYVDEVLTPVPERLVVVSSSKDAVKIVRAVRRKDENIKMLLADAARTPHLLSALGAEAEGLEGTAPSLNPTSGFDRAYRNHFGEAPSPYAATTFDALLLGLSALARNLREDGLEDLGVSMNSVVSGETPPILTWSDVGTKVGRFFVSNLKGGVDRFIVTDLEDGVDLFFVTDVKDGISRILALGEGDSVVTWRDVGDGVDRILHGNLPELRGASGNLRFDERYGVDPVSTYYSHWAVENGEFVIRERFDSKIVTAGNQPEKASAVRTGPSARHGALHLSGDQDFQPDERKGLKAVIAAFSSGWKNYRHQADALAVYHFLKDNGVDDEDIILFLVDDIPGHALNPFKGEVRHEPDGENLRENVLIDYSGADVSAANLRRLFAGDQTTGDPPILKSDAGTDILLFLVGHGEPGRLLFHDGEPLLEDELESALRELARRQGYRRMLIVSEVCYGESLGKDLRFPGLVYLTGSAEREQSFAANYDFELNNWLADDFTLELLQALRENPAMSLADLHAVVYSRVAGSHVRMMNYQNCGDLNGVPAGSFFKP